MGTIFHRTAPPWLEFAKDLLPGGSVRVGDSLKVSFNGIAYQMYDFREKNHEVYEPTLTLAEKLVMLEAQRTATAEAMAKPTPPIDCMRHPRDWPADARLWFYDSRLNDDDLLRLGYCWSPGLQRVILPFNMLRGGRLFIARDPWWSRESKRPKYLRPPGNPGAGVVRGADDLVVVTEDLVSAQRINDVTGVTTVPLMGTSLSRDDALLIAKSSKRTLLWLDPDGAGGMGQMAVRKVLRSFDLDIKGFDRYGAVDKVDPKKLPNEVIGEIIGEALNE